MSCSEGFVCSKRIGCFLLLLFLFHDRLPEGGVIVVGVHVTP